MQQTCAGRQNSDAFSDGVSTCAGAVLNAQTGQQGVGFDDVFHVLGDQALFSSKLSADALAQDGLVAGLSNSLASQGLMEAGVNIVGGSGSDVSAALGVSSQSVTDAGNQETDGSLGDDVGIQQNQVGVLLVVTCADVLAFSGVNDGQTHSGSVGGSSGGNNDGVSAIVVSNSLGSIHGLAAADTNNDIGGQVLGQSGAAQDLVLGALAAELLALDSDFGTGIDGLKLFLHVCEEEYVDQEENLLAVDVSILLDVFQFVTALDVAAGRAPSSGGMSQHGHWELPPKNNYLIK